MSAHVEGPWHAYVSRKTLEVQKLIDGKPFPIAHWVGFDASDFPWRKKVANARLMAASPELLDALIEARALLSDERECYFESHRNRATGEVPEVCQPYLESLDAALAKADAAIAKAAQP